MFKGVLFFGVYNNKVSRWRGVNVKPIRWRGGGLLGCGLGLAVVGLRYEQTKGPKERTKRKERIYI